MNKKQLKLIERLKETICCFRHSQQECVIEVEKVVGWFNVNSKEKREIVKYFKTEYKNDPWISEMIKDVFSYVEFGLFQI